MVYSKEEPIKPNNPTTEKGRHIPASSAFVPATAGLIIAGEVIKDLINWILLKKMLTNQKSYDKMFW